ncbi:hypothetical protein I310_05882 [Cryptococcus deuterogattii CA1014]|nr:hypothetical protein I310_05882 [Cryptococcus deuterogattii CA1014]
MSQARAPHHMTSGLLHPYLDRAMKPVWPKYLYPLFIGTQMIVFWGITFEEKPHVHQVERFAQGEFDYHDEDLHMPVIWHFFVSLPFYLLRATPTLSTLRLISLAQALILPTVTTLVTNPTPSPRPPVFQRLVDAIRDPSDFGLVCGLNPLAILMAVRFTPGLSCLLCLLILWRLSIKGNHWMGAAVAAGIGLLRAGVMFWVIFVIGWTAHEIMLFKRFRWTGPWALTSLFTYTVSGTTTNNQVILVDQCLPIFILRLYLLYLQGKETAEWQERRMEVLEEGRSEVRLERIGVNGRLPDITRYAYGRLVNQTETEASSVPEQREEEPESLVGLNTGEEQRAAVVEEDMIERERTEDTEVEGQEPQQRVQKMHIGRIELGWYLLSIALGALIILLVGNNN